MARERQIRNLDELMDGAMTARFNYEMKKVLENALDQNTSYKVRREIRIEVGITPNENRDEASFTVEVKSKLAPTIKAKKTVYLRGNYDGTVEAVEITTQTPGQIGMDGEVYEPNVVRFGE